MQLQKDVYTSFWLTRVIQIENNVLVSNTVAFEIRKKKKLLILVTH